MGGYLLYTSLQIVGEMKRNKMDDDEKYTLQNKRYKKDKKMRTTCGEMRGTKPFRREFSLV
jgi:hypothetical protein